MAFCALAGDSGFCSSAVRWLISSPVSSPERMLRRWLLLRRAHSRANILPSRGEEKSPSSSGGTVPNRLESMYNRRMSPSSAMALRGF